MCARSRSIPCKQTVSKLVCARGGGGGLKVRLFWIFSGPLSKQQTERNTRESPKRAQYRGGDLFVASVFLLSVLFSTEYVCRTRGSEKMGGCERVDGGAMRTKIFMKSYINIQMAWSIYDDSFWFILVRLVCACVWVRDKWTSFHSRIAFFSLLMTLLDARVGCVGLSGGIGFGLMNKWRRNPMWARRDICFRWCMRFDTFGIMKIIVLLVFI